MRNKKIKTNKKYRLRVAVSLLLFFILLLVLFSGQWGMEYFQIQSFDQIVFHIKMPLEGTNSDVLVNWADSAMKPALSIFMFSIIVIMVLSFMKSSKNVMLLMRKFAVIPVSLALILAIVKVANDYEVPKYLAHQKQSTNLFETYYVDATNIEFDFPEQKRNLIYIFLESMETTFSSTSDIIVENVNEFGLIEKKSMSGGGYGETSYIPNISKKALTNYNFSNTDGLGGAFQATNVGWTIAAMVAQTSGVPLTLPIEGNSYGTNADTLFLPGVFSIGEILKNNGYNQMLMVGSDVNFGGRGMYFKQHGDYEIFDLFTAQEEGKLPEGYRIWWGYEDEKLFSFAQEELTKMAQQSEPFNFTMLTADTHHPDGYNGAYCVPEGSIIYTDVVQCHDIVLNSFLDWINAQSWAENTTVVISGDHLSMNTSYMNQVDQDGFDRRVFNTIINPVNPVEERTKNREFSTMDMYPTTLASLGVTWDGDRLGLGTNLWSSTPTIPEQIGVEEFNVELLKYSEYYQKNILFATEELKNRKFNK